MSFMTFSVLIKILRTYKVSISSKNKLNDFEFACLKYFCFVTLA